MQVTFLIGNGFDLRLGLNTRYTDMYDGYIASKSKSDVVDRFKRMLQKDRRNDYKSWSDFEMAMGAFAGEFNSEDDFVECIRDFKLYLRRYLSKENLNFKDVIEAESEAKEPALRKLINGFYLGQTPNVKNEMNERMEEGARYFDFINFNYTDTLNLLIKKYEEKYIRYHLEDVIHIHGTLPEGIVLGVDNDSQIKNCFFPFSKKLDRAFVKTKFNYMFDKTRFRKAEVLIEKSDVICIYGMSLGESDKTWVEKIKEWLLKDQTHHLFYFYHSELSFEDADWDEKMDEEDRRKGEILQKIFDTENERVQVFDQLHIPVGYDMLEFDIKNSIDLNELENLLLGQ